MKEQIRKEVMKVYDQEASVDEVVEKLLVLFNVVGQSKQLCEGLHSTDFNGKCFKCGEQVFVREPK